MIELPPKLADLLLDSVSEGLALLDENGLIAWANAAFCGRIGASRDTCYGRSVAELDPQGRGTDGMTVRDLRPLGVEADLLRLPMLDSRLDTSQIGILPKASAEQRMDLEISRSRRYGNPLSCMLVSVPEDTSPETLRALARFLREQLRWVDITAWWDNATILVLLPETTALAAQELGRKLQEHSVGAMPDLPFQWSAATWQRGDDSLGLVVRARRGEGVADLPLRAQATR